MTHQDFDKLAYNIARAIGKEINGKPCTMRELTTAILFGGSMVLVEAGRQAGVKDTTETIGIMAATAMNAYKELTKQNNNNGNDSDKN